MKNKQYFEYIRDILIENEPEKINTIMFGNCNNLLMIVMSFKEYIVLFNDKGIFQSKSIKVEQKKFKKYTYLHDKGKNYLICSFDADKSYDLKIEITDVKVPKTKLNNEKINTTKMISSLFKNGKITFNKLDKEDKIDDATKQISNTKIPMTYIIVFIGIINLIITIMLIMIVYFKGM